ncbi:MAG: redox-sensing transcriptional repressor Rex [Spirochaetales bacterium]|nr:redox-sensing transcriptional repressor Rex [Spirochaetales bacterium]
MNTQNTQKGPEKSIPEQTLRRIPLYYQILSEMERQGNEHVSSKNLAQYFHVDDTQVRKDVAIIGYKGKPKSGYSVKGLKEAIEEFLGINYENTAILIGAGHLGSALAQYPGLGEYGLKLMAVFDNDPSKAGNVLGPFTVLPMEALQRVIRSYDIGIAIITVPKEAAQSVCNRIVSLGIKAIWNFAPIQLSVPADVTVRNENIATGIALLSHYLKTHKNIHKTRGEHEKSKTPPKRVIDIFNKYQPKREYLIPILEDTQKIYGYLPEDILVFIADFLNIPLNSILNTLKFYSNFRLIPPARYQIKICIGETCQRNGALDILEAISKQLNIGAGETTKSGLISLETVPCPGICMDGPVVTINDKIYKKMQVEKLSKLIGELLKESSSEVQKST